jgi:hypothetical protein
MRFAGAVDTHEDLARVDCRMISSRRERCRDVSLGTAS